jgi:hypothetical protein
MTSWGKLPFPWFGWSVTLRELRDGKCPHIPTVVEALEGEEPIPAEVRKFLADYLADRVNSSRGRPPAKNALEQEMDDNFLRTTFDFFYRDVEKDRPGTPHEVALARTKEIAAKHGMHLSEDTVKKRLKSKNKSKAKPKPKPKPKPKR